MLYIDGCVCKEAFSLLTCSDIVMHVSSELCLVPTTYTVVTAVLSIVATWMVSWNNTVEYMYTQSSLCVFGGVVFV